MDSYSPVRPANETGNENVSGIAVEVRVFCICFLTYLFEARLCSVAEAAFELLQSSVLPLPPPAYTLQLLVLFFWLETEPCHGALADSKQQGLPALVFLSVGLMPVLTPVPPCTIYLFF